MKLASKVTIITGGSQGIGEAIAHRYAAEGAKVAIVYHRNNETAASVAAAITRADGTATAIKADISQARESERLAAAVIGQFRRVDILVNKAGLFRTVSIKELRRRFGTIQ